MSHLDEFEREEDEEAEDNTDVDEDFE